MNFFSSSMCKLNCFESFYLNIINAGLSSQLVTLWGKDETPVIQPPQFSKCLEIICTTSKSYHFSWSYSHMECSTETWPNFKRSNFLGIHTESHRSRWPKSTKGMIGIWSWIKHIIRLLFETKIVFFSSKRYNIQLLEPYKYQNHRNRLHASITIVKRSLLCFSIVVEPIYWKFSVTRH